MKIQSLLFVLIIAFVSKKACSQYFRDDVNILREIDIAGDVYNNLNWSISANPAEWTGVTWSDSDPKKVTKIDITNKGITGSFDVSKLTALETLFCDDNYLTTIYTNPNLGQLSCSNNELSSFLFKSPNLWYLNCSDNPLSNLDVSYLNKLRYFICNNCNLSGLSVSSLTELSELQCNSNKLTSLNVTGLVYLIDLRFSNNNISNIDLTGLTSLTRMDCDNNKLPFSSLVNYTYVGYLFCDPQKKLYSAKTNTGDVTLNYSQEALINNNPTTFKFYKNGSLVETNTTGIYTTTGGGVYFCEMTNPIIPYLTLTTNNTTITDPVISLPASTITISPMEGGNATIDITSNIAWSASCPDSWLTLSAVSGTNNGSITVTATANSSAVPRSTTVTISGNGLSQTVSITQATTLLTASQTSVSLNCFSGSTADFSITSNIAWTISGQTDWLKVNPNSGTGNSTVALTALANTNSSARTATLTLSGNGLSMNVIITQQAPSLSVPSNTVTITSPAANSTATARITSNISWIVVSSGSWLTANPISGTNTATITLTATANNTGAARTANITVYGQGDFSEISQVIAVTQTALSATSTSVSMKAPAYSTETIEIRANTRWSITDVPDWLIVSDTTGVGIVSISLTAEENRSYAPRVGTIAVTDGNETLLITVTQEAKNKLTFTNESDLPEVTVFPNPVSQYLTIMLSSSDVPANICIYTAEGSLVLAEETPSSFTEIDMGPFKPGLYVYTIQSHNRMLTGKIVKR